MPLDWNEIGIVWLVLFSGAHLFGFVDVAELAPLMPIVQTVLLCFILGKLYEKPKGE